MITGSSSGSCRWRPGAAKTAATSALIPTMLAQEPPDGAFELIVATSVTEGTGQILRERADENASLRVTDNPGQQHSRCKR